jgi:hypothetical protein
MPVQMQVAAQNIPEWMQKEAQELSGIAAGLQRQQFPKYDIGKRIVPLENIPGMREAMLAAAAPIRHGEKEFAEARQAALEAQRGVNPGDIAHRVRQSRILAQELDPIFSRAKRAFSESIAPKIEARFLRLGQHGSSRHAHFLQNASADIAERLHDIEKAHSAKMWEQASKELESEKLRKLEASRLGMLMPNIISNIENEAANRQMNILMMQHAQAQRAASMGYEDFMREQMWPQEQLALRASLLHGIPYSRQHVQYSHEAAPQEPRMNFMGQLGAGAANLLALQNLLGGRRG